jgi:hypothetical protein
MRKSCLDIPQHLFLCFGKTVQTKVNAPSWKENITELIRDQVIGQSFNGPLVWMYWKISLFLNRVAGVLWAVD